MKGRHCRLYDEHLVKNILISAGLMTVDYLKDKKVVDKEDVCEFLEVHADSIIDETLGEMDNLRSPLDKNQFNDTSEFWSE